MSGLESPRVSTALSAEHAGNAIRRRILEGFAEPGTRLSELRLSRELGIGRAPVREASQRLSMEGLVTMIPNRGVFVVKLSAEQIVQLFEVREALEIQAVRLAVLRAPVEALASLRETLAVSKLSIVQHGGHYPVALNFHEMLVALVGNPFLSQQAMMVQSRLKVMRTRSGFSSSRVEASYEEHLRIIEAVQQRNGAAAEEAMRDHLRMLGASLQTTPRTTTQARREQA